jgi:hypothetical protein
MLPQLHPHISWTQLLASQLQMLFVPLPQQAFQKLRTQRRCTCSARLRGGIRMPVLEFQISIEILRLRSFELQV